MDTDLVEYLSYTIALPVVVSFFRLKNADPHFYPFFAFVWIGLLTELITTYSINHFQTNAVVANVYILLESLLLTWQFKRWQLFDKRKQLFYFLIAGFSMFWLIEIVLITSIKGFSSYFRITYSFLLVLMSITMINRLILTERKLLLFHPIFLACLAFIAFFTCKLLIEIFWVYGLNGSRQFRTSVYNIMTYVNTLVNLIYALVILWIPRKQEYILQ